MCPKSVYLAKTMYYYWYIPQLHYCGCLRLHFFVFVLVYFSVCLCDLLTVAFGSSIAITNATASEVQERTVSVRPSLNMRVMEDSYVRQNTPWSCKQEGLVGFGDTRQCKQVTEYRPTLNCASCRASWMKASGLVLHFLIRPLPKSANK